MRLAPWIEVFVVALAVLPRALPAAERIASFDPAASEVSFVLQATGHKVRGVFSVESGAIRWDTATGAASGEIVVDAVTGETGNARRDEKMHSQVLESALFPRVIFRVQRLEGEVAVEGRSIVRLIGSLSLHGSEHPMTVDAEVLVNGERLGAVASFEIPYVEWGLRDASVFVLRVAKRVAVTVELSGTLGLGCHRHD